ncbi:MAG: hypothetical protein QW520_07565 [Methanomassiliicoccales archaeon]
MKVFVRVIFLSNGMSPAEAEAAMKNLGFFRMKGRSTFEAEVPDEAAGSALIERMHLALRNAQIIYEPTIGRAPEITVPVPGSYRERIAKWKEIGLDLDELSDLIQYDRERFRVRAMEMFRAQVERVAMEREREIREMEEKERMERAREKIVNAVKQTGGQTFQQLLVVSGIDEDTLMQMLDEMVEKGQIVARQSGRKVAYTAP